MMKKLLFITGVLCLWASSSFGLSLSDIETEIRRHVRDTATDTSLQRYSDSVLDNLINETQREVINQTWAIQTSTNFDTVANTTYYSLPNNLIAIIQVEYLKSNGRKIDLEEISERALREKDADYEKQSGEPQEYFTRTSTYAVATLEWSPYPIPTSSSTGTVRVQYFNLAADLSTYSDIPFDSYRVLYPYHYTLVWGTVSKIKRIEGKEAEANSYLQLYQNSIAIMQNRLGRAPNYAPGFSGGNPN